MQMQQLLDSIPDVRNDIAGQRCRTCRFDDIEPVGLAFHVRQPVEETEQWEEHGEAVEQPCRCGLYLGYNPERV